MKTIIWRARGILLAVVSAAAAGACGGEAGPTSPPPPGPPPPPPGPTIGASLNLRPGEVHVLSERDAIRAFEIQGAAEGREYQVIVMSASLSEGRTTPLRVRARADDVSPNVVPNPRTNRGGRDAAIPPARGLAGELRPDRDWHLRQMIETERELRRLRARPAGGIGRASRGLAAAISDVPRVGDTLTVRSAIVPGGGVQCTANTPIKSTVRTVGEHFIIVEDDRLAGRFTEEDYADLDRELDEFIAPVSHEYFGEPEDLDGNQRVIAFFTGEVNRLSEPESGSVVIGFHWIGNLFERENCPASNEAEIVWLIGPDPDAEFGIEIGADFVKRVARSLVAHEYQHLLNASQRLGGQRGQNTWGNADLWVNEGLSHVAEEVTGFYRQGLRVRGNYGYTELIAGDPDLVAFRDFFEGNLENARQYPSAPTEFNPLALNNNTLDFATRGWGYVFVRWFGDRYGPAGPGGIVAGSGEAALYRELAVGGPGYLFGYENFLRAAEVVGGETTAWGDVLAEYFAASAADDAHEALPDGAQFSTWNWPRLWEELRTAGVRGLTGGDPLRRRIIQMGAGVSSTDEFDLGSSTARYYHLRAAGGHPSMIVETTIASGGNVPNSAEARIIVVRTR